MAQCFLVPKMELKIYRPLEALRCLEEMLAVFRDLKRGREDKDGRRAEARGRKEKQEGASMVPTRTRRSTARATRTLLWKPQPPWSRGAQWGWWDKKDALQ